MGLLKNLGGAASAFFSGGTSEILDGAGTLVKNVGDASVSIREALTGEPSQEKVAEALKRLDELTAASDEMQDRINFAMASRDWGSVLANIYMAGWRPGIGWACAVALWLYFTLRIIITMLMWSVLAWQVVHSATPTLPPIPEMGITDILGLTGSLLGMSWLRSKDKMAGISR